MATESRIIADEAAKPNIVFILADDLGYGDLGCFGQKKIRTPHLDKLAAAGMRFTQHYSGNAVCAPSRCVLMTGKHPGHASIRNNHELTPKEGQVPIPADVATLGKLLQTQGYVTGAFGKWGLGGPDTEGRPLQQGFNRFFGYNCQRVAHSFYPASLWDDEQLYPLNNPGISGHQKLPNGADPNDPRSYAGFTGQVYSADVIAEQALQFIRDNQDRPFFLYAPTTIPHLALQAPADALKEYDGVFSDDPPYVGGGGYVPHRTPRACYAAMVTRLDAHVGKMVSLVKELGLTERTLFVFSSDNGPPDDTFGDGGTDKEFFESAGPLRGEKGSLYEAGIRVPTITSWQGRIPAGATSDRVTGFEDWIPTLLDLIGANDAAPRDLDGLSFAPTLLGQQQEPRPFLYREFWSPSYGGQVCLRREDWKGVVQGLTRAKGGGPGKPWKIELYNLISDLAETTDVSADHPEIVSAMDQLMRQQHTSSADFPFPALDQR